MTKQEGAALRPHLCIAAHDQGIFHKRPSFCGGNARDLCRLIFGESDFLLCGPY